MGPALRYIGFISIASLVKVSAFFAALYATGIVRAAIVICIILATLGAAVYAWKQYERRRMHRWKITVLEVMEASPENTDYTKIRKYFLDKNKEHQPPPYSRKLIGQLDEVLRTLQDGGCIQRKGREQSYILALSEAGRTLLHPPEPKEPEKEEKELAEDFTAALPQKKMVSK